MKLSKNGFEFNKEEDIIPYIKSLIDDKKVKLIKLSLSIDSNPFTEMGVYNKNNILMALRALAKIEYSHVVVEGVR